MQKYDWTTVALWGLLVVACSLFWFGVVVGGYALVEAVGR